MDVAWFSMVFHSTPFYYLTSASTPIPSRCIGRLLHTAYYNMFHSVSLIVRLLHHELWFWNIPLYPVSLEITSRSGAGPPTAPPLPSGDQRNRPLTLSLPPVGPPLLPVSPRSFRPDAMPASQLSDLETPHGCPKSTAPSNMTAPRNPTQTPVPPMSPPSITGMTPRCPPPSVATDFPAYAIPPAPYWYFGATTAMHYLFTPSYYPGTGTEPTNIPMYFRTYHKIWTSSIPTYRISPCLASSAASPSPGYTFLYVGAG